MTVGRWPGRPLSTHEYLSMPAHPAFGVAVATR